MEVVFIYTKIYIYTQHITETVYTIYYKLTSFGCLEGVFL